MGELRVRACIKCSEYAIIRPNDPLNQNLIKDFEKIHSDHMVITVDIEEVKGSYINIESKK